MTLKNLFSNIPTELPEEYFEELESGRSFKIKRIVSSGHCSPKDDWYDQKEHEWVVLLQGAARIEFANEGLVELGPGDYLTIPAGSRHRVDWTKPNARTVWLAIYFEG